MKRRKQFLILGIILFVFGLGIGYSFLTTTLNISGIADVESNTWNVFFDHVQVVTGSVSGNQVTQAPTIDTNKTTVSFQINLKQPGDYYEFTVDAKNTGSIDAMIDAITKSTVPDYLKYTVSYNDDRELYTKQYLKSNKTETLKVRVEYRTDITATDLPETPQSINLSFGTTYVQADSTAQPRIMYYESNYNVGEEWEAFETVPSSEEYVVIERGEGTIKRIEFINQGIHIIGADGGAAFEQNTIELQNYCTTGFNHSSSSASCFNSEEIINIYSDGSFVYAGPYFDCHVNADGTYHFEGDLI